jgi:hypothetical protein
MQMKPSSVILIVANLVPLGGVLWLGWEVFDILLLYWTESVIIGVLNVLRMISSQSNNILSGLIPTTRQQDMTAALEQVNLQLPMQAIKFFIIPFFVFHYGLFCYGHLSAVVGFFGNRTSSTSVTTSIPDISNSALWIAVGAIAASHLYSYFNNFLGKGEYKRVGLGTLMHRPYGRIIVMHLSIIFGAGGAMMLGNPLPVLLVLIVGKTVLDVRMHNKERRSFAVE